MAVKGFIIIFQEGNIYLFVKQIKFSRKVYLFVEPFNFSFSNCRLVSVNSMVVSRCIVISIIYCKKRSGKGTVGLEGGILLNSVHCQRSLTCYYWSINVFDPQRVYKAGNEGDNGNAWTKCEVKPFPLALNINMFVTPHLVR